jgi:hypothetical protein
MADRDPVQADFVGKTIAAFDSLACNVWRFAFTDGTAIAIEAETFGQHNLPMMVVCEECAEDFGKPVS